LTPEEIKATIQKGNLNLNEEIIDNLILKASKDQNGKINLKDFIQN
jgi:Ca2+-binding EF-hand superfamily protein